MVASEPVHDNRSFASTISGPETGEEVEYLSSRKPSLHTLEERFGNQAELLFRSTRTGRKYGEWFKLLQKLQVTCSQIQKASAPNTPEAEVDPNDLQLENPAAQGDEGGSW